MSVSVKGGYFVNTRGQQLRTILYQPAAGVNLKGAIARHHGLGDYCERVKEANTMFAENGFAVWTFDAHGHGKSEPLEDSGRYAIRKFDDVVEDFQQFITEMVGPWCASQAPSLPLFFTGSSMGGLVIMHVVGRGEIPKPAGVVLSCAAAGVVRTALMRVQEPFAAILNSFMPKAKLLPFLAPESMCVSDEAAQLMREDAMLNKEPVMVCTACSMLEGMNTLSKHLPGITCPVMMLHGQLDTTCQPFAARKALESMASPDRTWVLLTEAKHNLEMDVFQQEWQRTVLQWLVKQSAPPKGEVAAEAAGAVAPVEEIKI